MIPDPKIFDQDWVDAWNDHDLDNLCCAGE